MQDIKIHEQTRINPLGRERYYHGDTDTGILVIHGFTGHSGEMDFLGQSLHQQTGHSVYIPRLPGHATNASDFRQSTARDWLRATYDNYLQLRDSYQRVQVVGLSMGGLLGLLTAARFKVEKLVLIAAALYVKNWLVPFTHILKYIKPAIPRDENSIPAPPEAENEHEIFHNQEYYTHNYTAQVAELHKLMRLTRSRLTRVTSPTLILASKEDDTVPLKAAYRIKSKISADQIQLHIFEESPHVINNGPEKEECAARVIDFLDSA